MPSPDDRRPSTLRNGATQVRIRGLAVADGAPYPYDDPMSKVLGLDAQTTGPVAWLGYTLGAFALLLGLMVSARAVTMLLASMNRTTSSSEGATQEIEVMKEDVPPPPPAPTEAEQKPEPAPPPRAIPHEAPPPPAAPAQASKVLTQEPDPNEPVDLTGNTIVTGNAESYAGGTTASNGTSTHAVRGLASPGGVPTGTGGAPPPKVSGPDRSRAASVGGTEWNCPFPPEADTAQIDEAYVTLQVEVRPDGSAGAVRVLTDPGNGFGREARRCAMNMHFPPALDHDGTPIPGSIKPKVHFSR
jgi:protein TonB